MTISRQLFSKPPQKPLSQLIRERANNPVAKVASFFTSETTDEKGWNIKTGVNSDQYKQATRKLTDVVGEKNAQTILSTLISTGQYPPDLSEPAYASIKALQEEGILPKLDILA